MTDPTIYLDLCHKQILSIMGLALLGKYAIVHHKCIFCLASIISGGYFLTFLCSFKTNIAVSMRVTLLSSAQDPDSLYME